MANVNVPQTQRKARLRRRRREIERLVKKIEAAVAKGEDPGIKDPGRHIHTLRRQLENAR